MQICKLFADSKSRVQELSNDVSFVIFVHQTWDLEGGGQIDPLSISWFSGTPAELTSKKFRFSFHLKHWVSATNSDFFNSYIFAIQFAVDLRYFKLWITSNNLSLKYQRTARPGCKDIGITKFKFVAKTQNLYIPWMEKIII